MKNTYVKCADWSWEDKLLYIKACIGDDMPHNKICGYVCHDKDELLDMYKRVGVVIHCCDDGMISFDVAGAVFNAFDSVEVKLSELKQEKPKPTKFVKVEESIFDLKGEFERGELYFSEWGEEKTFAKIKKEHRLMNNLNSGNVYRKVEIDWRESVIELAPVGYGIKALGNNDIRIDGSYNKDQALILASAIIASLTEKPEGV